MDYAERFAANIRDLRHERGLTQKGFAEQLGYSEKTISKWECGESIPGIETLFKIAESLQTNIEALFYNGELFFLGIDGGGTKTELVLMDERGSIVRTLLADTCNPIDIGIERAKEVLKQAIYRISEGIPRSSVVMYAGISGGTTAQMQEKLSEFFAEFNFRAYYNDSDSKLIIAAGLGDDDGVALIIGTGICAFTQRNGEHFKTAGWGYFIDNGGSAYNLGRDALNAYLTAQDGTGEKTLLTEEIDKLLPGGVKAIMGHIYSGGKKAVAKFSAAVFTAIERGDKVAEAILRRNMKEAARVVIGAAKHLPQGPVRVVAAGGLTDRASAVSLLREALPEGFTLEILDKKPVHGALLLAQKLVRREIKNV